MERQEGQSAKGPKVSAAGGFEMVHGSGPCVGQGGRWAVSYCLPNSASGTVLLVVRSITNLAFFSWPGGTLASPGPSSPKVCFGRGKPFPHAVAIVSLSAWA